MAAPSGRVLKYDVASNSSKVLMDELSFANGIVLSPDEDFLLVYNVIRLWINKRANFRYSNQNVPDFEVWKQWKTAKILFKFVKNKTVIKLVEVEPIKLLTKKKKSFF